MTYNEFKLRFAIQYVGSVNDPGECMRRMDNAAALARLLWGVMNAPEVQAPAAPITANSPSLRTIALAALEASNNKARWIAIDASGGVWAYDLRPDCYEEDKTWDNSPTQGSNWFVRIVAPPADFTKELYEISQILEFSKNMANSPKDMDNLTELKALARMTPNVVAEEAQYIAVDANGEVWVFDLKPSIDALRNAWDNSDCDGFSWQIGAVAPPADFRNEIYEIDKLLENDND